jgi:LPS-assembly lipoprotein
MRLRHALWLLIASTLLVGCGFRPLYGTGGPGAAATGELQAVRIELIADRSGQQLRNALQHKFGAGRAPARYTLAVALSERVIETAIRRDETASRANLFLDAAYTLAELPGGKPLSQGVVRATNSFNVLPSDYATYVSEKDARERAVEELATALETRLALFFDQRKNAPADAGGELASLP